MRSLTRSCFLLLVLGRLLLLALPFLIGICLPSRWSPPFPLHALALILPLAKVRLSPTLTLSSLMIWCFELTALFFFLLARAAPAFLPTALSVALRPLFPFRQAQYAQVFPLKPAPFCTLFADLGSTNKSAISLLFSYYLTLVLSSPPSFRLSQTLWQIWQELSSLSFCSIRLQWVPDNRFSRGTTRPDGERYLRPPQPLIGLSSLISDWRRTVPSKFFDTQVSSISTEELVLSRLRCNGHSLFLGSYLSRIENPSCSACGHLSSHSALSSYRLFVSLRPLGNCPASGAPRSSIPRKGSGKQQQHYFFVADVEYGSFFRVSE